MNEDWKLEPEIYFIEEFIFICNRYPLLIDLINRGVLVQNAAYTMKMINHLKSLEWAPDASGKK